MKNEAIYAGILLIVLSVCGIVYSSRVILAQSLYYRAKYTVPPGACQNIIELCGRASRYYMHNYYVCILAAETAYYESFITAGNNVVRHLAEAEQWCDKGLAMNFYRMPLRRLKAHLMARVSPAAAAEYWSEFVAWQYWEPSNHELLVELYARAGQYEKAVDSLGLIKDSPRYQAASMKLSEAWKKEKDFPSELFQKRSK